MSKNNKNKGAKGAVVETKVPVVTVPNTTEVKAEVAAPAATATVVAEKRKPGRPKTKIEPEVKEPKQKGRPVVEGSKCQQRVAELEAKRKAGLLKKGRPKMDPAELEAQRAKRKAEKELAAKAVNEAVKNLETASQEIADTANAAIQNLAEAEAGA